MGLLNWLRGGSTESVEHTYGGKDVDELQRIPDPRTVSDHGHVMELNEPRVAWKAVGPSIDPKVLKLVVPEGARVVYPSVEWGKDSKLRTNAVYVVETYDVEAGGLIPCESNRFESRHEEFYYEKGTVAVPDEFDDNKDLACTNGIHIFHHKGAAIFY